MIIRRVWPKAVTRAKKPRHAGLLDQAARALEPDLATIRDGDHVRAAEAVGGGPLGALDEVDGALVLSLAQERRSLGGNSGDLCVGHRCNLLG